MGDNEKQEAMASDDVSSSEEALKKLQDERDDLYDRLLRKQAEFDNFRKRAERERIDTIQSASSELMRELLNPLDSFDLAIRNAQSEPENEKMLQGFTLIHKQIQDVLARFGLKAVEAKGARFDPNFHQAVSTTPTLEFDENTVVEELRKGYLLNGKLLRPAMVSVAVRGERGASD